MQPDLWTDQNFEPFVPDSPSKPGRFSAKQGLLLGLGLGALLTLGLTKLGSQAPRTPATAPVSTSQPAPALAVTTARVESALVNRTISATGTVAPVEMSPVLSQTSGLQIQQILVDEGDTVIAGQLLARLDDSILQAQKTQAQASIAQAQARLAELEAGSRREEIARAKETVKGIEAEKVEAASDWDLARKRVERNQTLQAEGAIAQDRLDEVLNEERSKKARLTQVEARLREAQAQLEELLAGPRLEVKDQAIAQLAEARSRLQLVEAQLKNTRILAPVGGKVVKRNAKLGDVTGFDSPLFEIIADGRLELQLQIPESQLKAIRLGQGVKISSSVDSRLSLRGQVEEIFPTVDATSRQGLVKVSLPTNTSLKSGMFLQGAIITATTPSYTIPMSAVLPQADGSALVYLLQPEQRVKAQRVKIGQILPQERVEVISGLGLGDVVVSQGAGYLKDGDRILAKNP